MPDNVDDSFDHFDEGLPVNPLPAAEVRRRGDRLRRRNTVLATVGGVAAAAVFIGVPVAVVAGGRRGAWQPHDPAPASPSPTPTPYPPSAVGAARRRPHRLPPRHRLPGDARQPTGRPSR